MHSLPTQPQPNLTNNQNIIKMSNQPTYKHQRITKIEVLNNPHHPYLKAYSNMVDRLEKLRHAGKCNFDGACGWMRYTFNTAKGQKSVQLNDRVTFPNEDDIKYTVSITFYQFI